MTTFSLHTLEMRIDQIEQGLAHTRREASWHRILHAGRPRPAAAARSAPAPRPHHLLPVR